LSRRFQLALPLAFSVIAAISMWTYSDRILVQHQQQEAALDEVPQGNLSSLYPPWLGARELLRRHRDPYSDDITAEIQKGFFGRPLDPSRPNDPKDQQRFAYPVYVVFLLAPTIGVSFHVAQFMCFWFLMVLTAATVPLWQHALQWRPSAQVTGLAILLTLASYPAVQGLKIQQLGLLVAGFIAGAAALLASGHLFLAGALLALATIKPQLVFLLVAWLALWVAGDWAHRQRLLWGFAATMLILLIAAQRVCPGWVRRFAAVLAAYPHYTGASSILDELLTPLFGHVAAALVLFIAAVSCWRSRKAPETSDRFALTLAIVLVTTVIVIPMSAFYNQIIALPAVLLAVRWWRSLQETRTSRLLFAIATAVVAFPWLAAMSLVLYSLWTPAYAMHKIWHLPLVTGAYIPLTVLSLLYLLQLFENRNKPTVLNDHSKKM
jgi:hypothetical protein